MSQLRSIPSRSTPADALRSRVVELCYTADARSVAAIVDDRWGAPPGAHDEAVITIRHVPRTGHAAIIEVEASFRGRAFTIKVIEHVQATTIEQDGITHFDVRDGAGARLFALSLDGTGRLLFAQSPLINRIGLRGGRYAPPTLELHPAPARIGAG